MSIEYHHNLDDKFCSTPLAKQRLSVENDIFALIIFPKRNVSHLAYRDNTNPNHHPVYGIFALHSHVLSTGSVRFLFLQLKEFLSWCQLGVQPALTLWILRPTKM